MCSLKAEDKEQFVESNEEVKDGVDVDDQKGGLPEGKEGNVEDETGLPGKVKEGNT